jgi:ubiquinone/menaquinone biosynthesis C-methylase UbiE
VSAPNQDRQVAEAAWDDYWKKWPVSDKDWSMFGYRRILLNELSTEIQRRHGWPVQLLNAGSGMDPLPVYILKEYPELLITLLDISSECLDINRRYYESRLTAAELSRVTFVAGNIFELPFDNARFDIVYNTGVLEHFLNDDQLKMLVQFDRVLKPGGTFVTLNPCSRGSLYVAMKRYWEKTGWWPYGPEYPIRTLRELVAATFKSARLVEKNLDFAHTAQMVLQHNDKFIAWLGRSLLRLCRIKFLEWLLLKTFGGYVLLSRVQKAAEIPRQDRPEGMVT